MSDTEVKDTELKNPEVKETESKDPEVKDPEVDKEPVTKSPFKDDYSYMPKKFMDKEGKPMFDKLAKSYKELETKYHEKQPEIPDEYTIDDFEYEDLLNADDYKQFQDDARNLGLTATQFKMVMDHYKRVLDNMPHLQDHTEQFEQQWGDQYQHQMAYAQRATQKYLPDVNKYPELAGHPVMIQMMAKIGRDMREDVVPVSNVDNGVSGETVEERLKAAFDKGDYEGAERILKRQMGY